MNLSETALVLAKVQAFDNRTVGEATIAAWQEALAQMDVRYALAAVAEHFRTDGAWMMPVHVTRIAEPYKFRVAVRLAEFGQPDIPPGLAYSEARFYRSEYEMALLNGADTAAATARADEAVIAGNWNEVAPPWTAERAEAVTSYRSTRRNHLAAAPRRALKSIEGTAS